MATEVILLKEESKLEEIIKSEEKVLVYFFAEWCGPCKNIIAAKLPEKLAEQTPYTVVKVDADELGSLMGEHDVTALPTMATFVNGEETDRFVGPSSITPALVAKLKAL